LEPGVAGDPVRRRIREIRHLESLGAEVEVVAADVADPVGMRSAIDGATRRFGRIDGVFHAAGVIRDALIPMKTIDDAVVTMRPKIEGALVLEEVLAAQPPDFVVHFSSISATIGVPGQFDYAAANAFLDALADAAPDGPGAG